MRGVLWHHLAQDDVLQLGVSRSSRGARVRWPTASRQSGLHHGGTGPLRTRRPRARTTRRGVADGEFESALIAAERTGTYYYAMEIDPLYVEVALRRWERFSGQEAVRLDG